VRSPEARLIVTSATLLFTELLLIRWIPAHLVYVGFFNNFVLIATSTPRSSWDTSSSSSSSRCSA